MAKKEKAVLAWSGGKDSAVSLFEMKSPDFKLTNLLTTIEMPEGRVQAHGVRQSLIQKQAASLEIPILFVPVPEAPANAVYEKAVAEVVRPLQKKGLAGIAFGDIHLEDIKAYREKFLSTLEMKAFFPIWKWDNKEVLRVFFSLGFKAIVTAIDTRKLTLPFLGREFDRDFIDDLPSGVDSCGENGEFHTFVYDGPFFQRRIEFQKGKVFEKGHFGFIDLE